MTPLTRELTIDCHGQFFSTNQDKVAYIDFDATSSEIHVHATNLWYNCRFNNVYAFQSQYSAISASLDPQRWKLLEANQNAKYFFNLTRIQNIALKDSKLSIECSGTHSFGTATFPNLKTAHIALKSAWEACPERIHMPPAYIALPKPAAKPAPRKRKPESQHPKPAAASAPHSPYKSEKPTT